MISPLKLLGEVHDAYVSYLRTSFYFRDPCLRHSFEEQLERGHLVHGPFLECTPVFERRMTVAAVVGRILGPDVEPAFVAALCGERRLYGHQQAAIERLAQGRNVVLATGTGSGKTEAFLLPILCALYRERKSARPKPGVRALVLYPMNALANDQRRRLGEIAQALQHAGSSFAFTFGRYTGETPEDERDTRRKAQRQLENRMPGELVLRREMRQQPPDILLTNYSMLEYLLLRPEDSPLFDAGRGATWRFCVLDEAHQYRGARGMEMAMLLRRLRQRLAEGGLEQNVQFVATSASLGGGEQDRDALAEFAQQLSGSTFEPDDIVLETVAPVAQGSISFTAQAYADLHAILESQRPVPRSLLQIAGRHGLAIPGELSIEETLYEILKCDRRVAQLRKLLTEPRMVEQVKDALFEEVPREERDAVLKTFLNLTVRAREPGSNAPLVSLRYHLFLRALEGAYVRYSPTQEVSLARLGMGDTAEGAEHEGVAFEVAVCRECGQHYFVGQVERGYLREALRDVESERFRVCFFRPCSEDDPPESAAATRRLCLHCGMISSGNKGARALTCGHERTVLVVEEQASDTVEDQVRTCGACGYRGQGPVRELVHGADGPSAVIATAVHRCLPAANRKVLGFADGRQDAAFFAWYLQDSYQKVVARNLVFAALRSLAEEGYPEVSLESLPHRTTQRLQHEGLISHAADHLQAQREGWLYVFRELLSDEQRTSLEGVGLVQWLPVLPENLQIPASLLAQPWCLDHTEAALLVRWLLDSLRRDAAIELIADRGVSLTWGDLGLASQQACVAIGGRKNVKAWDGPRTRRALFLLRLLRANGVGWQSSQDELELVQCLLREVWAALREASPGRPPLKRIGDAFRADPAWWRIKFLQPGDPLYRCDVCGRYQSCFIRGVCTRHACPGSLARVDPHEQHLQRNHYRLLYAERLPARLRTEEHTAQIEPDQARSFQEDFERGDIHFLSCSTTFELGVDLGDLNTIFLRNVPPEPFNYAQRVGRAGRRPSQPGLAITYCRRRPHDLAHFQDPRALMQGRTRPPLLQISNPKIVWRHIVAVVLSEFFRYGVGPDRFRSVASFLVDVDAPKALDDVAAFVQQRLAKLGATLRTIVPAELHKPLGLHDGSWIARVTSPEERLAMAVAEVVDDYRRVCEYERQAVAEKCYKKADWASRRAKTIAGEELIAFLSRKAVIPKYGFPVDVVELDLQQARSDNSESSSVALQRDLAVAIAEYAPGTTLVANKKLWKPYGLKRVAEREWDVRQYRTCPEHGTFYTWKLGDQPPAPPCCEAMREHKYIDPLFGFVTDGSPPEEPRYRPLRAFTTRPYFLGMSSAEAPPIRLPSHITLHAAAPGRLLVLCEGRRGRGFLICPLCGAGADVGKAQHCTPLGRQCTGRPDRVALGHEFITDVLRIALPKQRVRRHSAANPGVAYSLAYALLFGAHEVLEVPLQDLSVTVPLVSGQASYEIILYDNVPGGAGLVARLETPAVFRSCLETARDRVQGACGCEPSTSCYGCLRMYANQFVHPYLARGPACEYLSELLAGWTT